MSLMRFLSIFVASVLLVRSTQGASIKFWPAHQPGYRADAQTARRRSIWRRWVLVLFAGFACFSVTTTPADAAGGVRIYGYDELQGGAIANLSRLTATERAALPFSVGFASGSVRLGMKHRYDSPAAFTTAAQFVATKSPGTPNTVPAPGGAARAAKWGSNWQEASLSKTVGEVAGPNPVVTSTAQKTIYTNPTTGTQVIYDRAGNYFRIADGNGQYLMLNGQPVPANVPILKPGGGSAMSGVPKDVRNGLTHFGATP
jgi:hypothetical protein